MDFLSAKSPTGVWQPPGSRHRELAHSKNVELIEVVSPARFPTVALPEAKPARSATRPRKAG